MALNGKKLAKIAKSTYKKGKKAYSDYKAKAPEREEERLHKMEAKMARFEKSQEAKLKQLETKKKIQAMQSEMREQQLAPYKKKLEALKSGYEKLQAQEGGGSRPPQMYQHKRPAMPADPLGLSSYGPPKGETEADALGLTEGRREMRNVRRAEQRNYKRARRPSMSMDKFLGLK